MEMTTRISQRFTEYHMQEQQENKLPPGVDPSTSKF